MSSSAFLTVVMKVEDEKATVVDVSIYSEPAGSITRALKREGSYLDYAELLEFSGGSYADAKHKMMRYLRSDRNFCHKWVLSYLGE